jgi:four helix bundle protein
LRILRGHRDLKAFQLAYALAMDVFQESRSFPREERYSLTDQIRRSSRNVAANMAEAFRKRQYPGLFVSRLVDADGEATETLVWLDFARDCGYVRPETHKRLVDGYELIGKMLGGMMTQASKFVSP